MRWKIFKIGLMWGTDLRRRKGPQTPGFTQELPSTLRRPRAVPTPGSAVGDELRLQQGPPPVTRCKVAHLWSRFVNKRTSQFSGYKIQSCLLTRYKQSPPLTFYDSSPSQASKKPSIRYRIWKAVGKAHCCVLPHQPLALD